MNVIDIVRVWGLTINIVILFLKSHFGCQITQNFIGVVLALVVPFGRNPLVGL